MGKIKPFLLNISNIFYAESTNISQLKNVTQNFFKEILR